MKLIKFEGWKDCIELKSGDFKIVVTTAVGPRVIGGFVGDSKNIFCVVPEQAGKTGGNEWNIYGGHRFWHAPEARPRTYAVENRKVAFKELPDGGVELSPGVDAAGIHRSMSISPLGGNKFRVEHRLRNESMWDIEVAAWALSVMDAGGTAVVPQPQGDPSGLLPNCHLSLWPYAKMSDSRIAWGDKFTLLRQDSRAKGNFKFGLSCDDGWLGYVNKGVGFVKRFEHFVDAEYPDNGCSVECYTNGFMLELETLSPLYLLAPGEELTHVEEWLGLSDVKDVKTEKDAALLAGKAKAAWAAKKGKPSKR